MAYRTVVTAGIVAPIHEGFLSGLSTSFSTGARHKLTEGAIIQDVNALHVSIKHIGSPSVSTQIGTLRHLLLYPDENTNLGRWFKKIAEVPHPYTFTFNYVSRGLNWPFSWLIGDRV